MVLEVVLNEVEFDGMFIVLFEEEEEVELFVGEEELWEGLEVFF